MSAVAQPTKLGPHPESIAYVRPVVPTLVKFAVYGGASSPNASGAAVYELESSDGNGHDFIISIVILLFSPKKFCNLPQY